MINNLSRKLLYTVILTIILVGLSGLPTVHAQVMPETVSKTINVPVFRLNDPLPHLIYMINESKSTSPRPGPAVMENITISLRWWAVVATEDQSKQTANGPTDVSWLFSRVANSTYKDIMPVNPRFTVQSSSISNIFSSKTFPIFTGLEILVQLVYFQTTYKMSKNSKSYLK